MKTDEEILAFYLANKEDGGAFWESWVAHKKLKDNPLFEEAKVVIRMMFNDIMHDERNAHTRKALIEKSV